MRAVFFRIFIFLIPALAVAAPVSAADLSVSSRSTLTIAGDRIQVNVFAANSGTEPAYQVKAYLHIFGHRYDSDAAVDLATRQSRRFQFSIPMPPGRTGEFPFVGEVVFHDAQRMPFTVLCAGTFKIGAAEQARITVAAPEIHMTASGRLAVGISSRDKRPLDIEATLFLPDALTTPQRQKWLRLDPFGSTTVEFPLASRPGNGAAAYPVFCILSATVDGRQQAAVVQSTVHLKSDENWFVRTRWYWLAAGIWLPLGWIFVGMRGIKDKKSSGCRSDEN